MRAFSPWLIVALIFLIVGLFWVFYKNQRVTRGRVIKDLENELADLRAQNAVLGPRIAELSSRPALKNRLDSGFVKMVPIAPERIVMIASGQPARQETASNELHVASSGGMMR